MKRSRGPEERRHTPPKQALCVTASDVARLDILQGLLSTLNDPKASAASLARYVEQSTVLSARIDVRFRLRNPNRGVPPLVQQIAILGNREIENVLLELLEDIVTLHSELADVG